MAELPTELLAKLNQAEQLLQTAKDRDQDHDQAHQAMLAAAHADEQSAGDALAAHQSANAAATDALAALKAHFGIAT